MAQLKNGRTLEEQKEVNRRIANSRSILGNKYYQIDARLKAGLTYKEIQAELHCSPGTISRAKKFLNKIEEGCKE